ncbi:MAG: hypothetical protein IPN92_09145 [Chromatiaceae bacterium]|nr:hypothetical protein [Chromatiaceae bacterium]
MKEPLRVSGLLAALYAMLATIAVVTPAQAALYEDMDLATCPAERTYAADSAAPEAINTKFGFKDTASSFFLELKSGLGCTGTHPTINCNSASGALKVEESPTANKDTAIPGSTIVNITTPAAVSDGQLGIFQAIYADAPDANTLCITNFKFRAIANGKGWGDPHLVTVDGVHYDFQSAGEFTALREPEFEVQTRQTPVPTATVPITNEYTGITHCVAIYTAVAAKFGKTRVTLQSGVGGRVNPESMELRVNGTLTPLTNDGIILRTGGGDSPSTHVPTVKVDGVIKKAAGGAIEMTDVNGTQLVVTPTFWNGQNLWYLDVQVFQTIATQGTMGKIAEGSWLPALPDGSSLGARPDDENQRYQDLYEKFADAWRVTDSSSLFDYATGESTSTYTLDEWPRNHPQSCDLPGKTSVQPATAAQAEAACSAVTDPVQKKDCVYDVTVTGNTGFGQSYVRLQEYRPHGPGWQTQAPSSGPSTPPPDKPHRPWWWWIVALILLLILIFWFMSRRKSTP